MRYSVVFLGVFLLILVLKWLQLPFLESIKERFVDLQTSTQTKQFNKSIVVVGIDEKSINRFGRWPWDRAVLAQGIEKLQQARVVGFDMVFSEPTPDDACLAQSIEDLPSSVCGFFLRDNATQSLSDAQEELLQDSSLDLLQSQLTHQMFVGSNAIEANTAQLMQSCTMQGGFSTLLAADKVHRFYPVAFYYHDTLYPSLGVQMLRLAYGEDVEVAKHKELTLHHQTLHAAKDGFVRLNYYKKNAYSAVSFADLYDGTVNPEFFQDKFVLFGVTEMGIGDVVSTPVGNLYGVFVHATFLSNYLNSELLQVSFWLDTGVLFVVMLFLFLILLRIENIVYRMVLYGGVYLLAGLLSLVVLHSMHIVTDMFYPLLGVIIIVLLQESWLFYTHDKDARFVKQAFANYLSADLLKLLVKNNDKLKLGGEKKELTILFSDIRNFTTLAEKLQDPQKLVALLNRYFTPMTESVVENHGMVDKYIGDAIMAFFNAPVAVQNHPQAACSSALAMIDKLQQLNEELVQENIAPIQIGIGIHTDEVVVGNMGATKRFNYTVIGDGVNVASRLEGKTKEYGVGIIISQATYDCVYEEFECRDLGYTSLKGKHEQVRIYELIQKK